MNNKRQVSSPKWMTIDPYYNFEKHSNPFICDNQDDQSLATRDLGRVHLLCNRCDKTYFWETNYEYTGKHRSHWAGLRALVKKSGWNADDPKWENLVCHNCNNKKRSTMTEVCFEEVDA